MWQPGLPISSTERLPAGNRLAVMYCTARTAVPYSTYRTIAMAHLQPRAAAIQR